MFASVKHSPVFRDAHVMRLTVPIRDAADPSYSKFVDSIGYGAAGSPPAGGASGVRIVKPPACIPRSHVFLCDADGAGTQAARRWITPPAGTDRGKYWGDRAILCSVNERVDLHNKVIDATLPGRVRTYVARDSVSDSSASNGLREIDMDDTLRPSGTPQRELHLRKGSIVMVLRNMDQVAGLVSGAKLEVLHLGNHVVEARSLRTGTVHFIPRIPICFQHRAAQITRVQLPLRLAYAATVHKSQGMTLSRVLLDFVREPFAHGVAGRPSAPRRRRRPREVRQRGVP